jgi:hypothetical protein
LQWAVHNNAVWCDAVCRRGRLPAAVLVGYEQGVSLRAAIAAGFRDLGPLRVWLAP